MFKIARNSLDWALLHAENFGDTDVFPLPFEYAALRHDWTRVVQSLMRLDLHDVAVRPHRRLMGPKARHGFRVVSQLDPLDFLLYTATVKEISTVIESARVPTSQEVVFSYRFDPSNLGQIFNPSINYAEFQRSTRDYITANAGVTHVVVTDIADFYPRIYHHRLENALQACGVDRDRVKAIMKLIGGWNGSESYGIPVGPAASRILAEATLIDVDEALMANQAQFKRFNDDYRLFCNSYTDAYRQLVFLADVLYKNHGLTLQGQKTAILSKTDFADRYLRTFEDRALNRLRGCFHELVEALNLENPYESINLVELTTEQQTAIDQLNLAGIYREEMASESGPDHSVLKFIFTRLGQVGDASIANDVLSRAEELHPLLPDIVEYFRRLGPVITDNERHAYGTRLLDMLNDSIASCLDFHRGWILSLFTTDTSWGNTNRLFPLLAKLTDQTSRRKLILALGRARQRHWFQSQWRDCFNEPPWPRRAILAGASCLPADASRHWYRAMRSRLDDLEFAVATWAEANPFV